jgi:hypothetical protein
LLPLGTICFFEEKNNEKKGTTRENMMKIMEGKERDWRDMESHPPSERRWKK